MVDLWHPGLTAAECDKITAHFPARPLPEDSEVLSVPCSPWLSLEVARHLSGGSDDSGSTELCRVEGDQHGRGAVATVLHQGGWEQDGMLCWRSTYINLIPGSFGAPLNDCR